MIRTVIAEAVEDILRDIAGETGMRQSERVNVVVEHPANLQHGDYSVNIAMQLAKQLRKPPLVIAGEIKERLQRHPGIAALFGRVEAVAPGFVNFYLDWGKWAAYTDAKPLKTARGMSSKVIIEHTSINPNKSAHIGHLRNSCIGDTLARMLRAAGHPVEVHNYIDDLGNQLADTLVGIHRVSADQPYSRFGDFCWDTYAGINKAYKQNPELQHERTAILHGLEKGTGSTAWLGLLVAERIVREHMEEMKQFGIGYDVLVWESSIVREGFWTQAFELLKTTSVFRQETEGKLAGCWVLKQAEDDDGVGDNPEHQADKVLVRSNGVLTYTAKDIAYHLWKFGVLGKDFRYRKFADRLWSTHEGGVRKKRIGQADTVINVIDHRQEYPQAMVKQALLALGFARQAERLRHVGYGVVSLSPKTAERLGVDISDGKASYPMSGRQGIGIKIAELLDRMEQVIEGKRSRKAGLSSLAIAAASIRYYLLRFHLQTEIVFDLEQATEVSGNTGVYLLYSYARACSVLDRVEQPLSGPPRFETSTAQESALLRQLAYGPETLEAAVAELSPHRLCAYAYELTNLFNHFYAVCPILKAEGSTRHDRLWLTMRFKATLREALDVLGLPAPGRM
ncbi:arginine--tRNA ligase [Paenibacillus hemerocallicola]|uniref:Arginine--tRNA ligase n=1 Tax=Paenibacillus hemerocallicola TaxID=1172614 RepID=A0A5C4T993_9BACL|nr:arginine--tRNA ligase [Paenibacillus hemerocallicola]TNJ65455.1 arginine--tRNA ligase [Paenibacillus hemerocallicola]